MAVFSKGAVDRYTVLFSNQLTECYNKTYSAQ